MVAVIAIGEFLTKILVRAYIDSKLKFINF